MSHAVVVVALACSTLLAHTIPCRGGPSAPAALSRSVKPSLFGERSSQLTTVERDVYLMGTWARLTVLERDRPTALAALETALASLEKTEATLSTWRADSAISSLNRFTVGKPWAAPPSLCPMFEDVYRWQRHTAGSFDPAIGALIEAWGIHDAGRVPSSHDVAAALARSGLDRIVFNRDQCTLTRTTDVTLDVGAFGKGEGLDRAAAKLRDVTWMIDLGGQVSVGARLDGSPWTIHIAHPANRNEPFVRVNMQHGSLSTSAGSERDQMVDGRRVGHILDPRTGRPAPFVGSVTVWHERGLIADILSTALFVMGPDKGIPWAEGHDISALYLIPDGTEVRVRVTSSFRRRLQPREVSSRTNEHMAPPR